MSGNKTTIHVGGSTTTQTDAQGNKVSNLNNGGSRTDRVYNSKYTIENQNFIKYNLN